MQDRPMHAPPAWPLQLSEPVAAALAAGHPTVALETSIVAHGLPAPDNVEVGLAMQRAVRQADAVPAMVAVLDGAVRVGLEDGEVERLAAAGAAKCSTRDIGPLVATGRAGGTTVAATARIAAAAGIRVFATGGIGGVHPGGRLDVSADLPELARAPVAVVSSGAKSILDLAATLELLETLGVPVIGWATDRFPAFHAVDSGLALKHRIDDAATLAAALRAHWALPGAGGVLVCHPPPAELAIPKAELDGLVGRGLAEAETAGVRGDAVTPYVLGALARLSGGRTLTVNRALAVANAGAGGRLAAALAEPSNAP